ncbi:unnamed protein product, partial [Iphiclides podalirius]
MKGVVFREKLIFVLRKCCEFFPCADEFNVVSGVIIMQSSRPSARIVEQPAKTYRFRYESEIKSASKLTGATSNSLNPTHPALEISGCPGTFTIVISCVDVDKPYKPHPNSVLNKTLSKLDDYVDIGVFRMTVGLNGRATRVEFDNLALLCATNKSIEKALEVRKKLEVDPFKTGYGHPSEFRKKLTAVRLCFQVFMMEGHNVRLALKPLVSDVITDTKIINNLVIHHVSHDSGPAYRPTLITIVCDKIYARDVTVTFFEKRNGDHWEVDVKAQMVGNKERGNVILCNTPIYPNYLANEKVYIQLKRLSDNELSNVFEFKYTSSRTASKTLSKSVTTLLDKFEDTTKSVCPTCLQEVRPPSNPADNSSKQIVQPTDTLPVDGRVHFKNGVHDQQTTSRNSAKVPKLFYDTPMSPQFDMNAATCEPAASRMDYDSPGVCLPPINEAFPNIPPAPSIPFENKQLESIPVVTDGNEVESIKRTYLFGFENGAFDNKDFDNILSGTSNDSLSNVFINDLTF